MSTKSYKVVLLGDSGVGKTCLANRIKFQRFPVGIESTIGCEFFAKTYTFPDNTSIKFLLWDTSGQEVFRTFTPQFCRAAYLALIFYDVGTTDDENELVKTIKDWISFTPESCTILIVPTKCDALGSSQKPRRLSDTMFVDTSRDVHVAQPTSAKADTGIDELLTQMAEILLPLKYRERDSDLVAIAEPRKKESCCST
jgi:small GTP-binding protein